MRGLLAGVALAVLLAGCASPAAQLDDAVADLTDAANARDSAGVVRSAEVVLQLIEEQRAELGNAKAARMRGYALAVREAAQELDAPVPTPAPERTPPPVTREPTREPTEEPTKDATPTPTAEPSPTRSPSPEPTAEPDDDKPDDDKPDDDKPDKPDKADAPGKPDKASAGPASTAPEPSQARASAGDGPSPTPSGSTAEQPQNGASAGRTGASAPGSQPA